jgi:cation transport regulator
MKYKTIKDLPFVWQINLPEAAQQVYKDAFNRAWGERRDEATARSHAMAAVRAQFTKDGGRWVRSAAVSAAPAGRLARRDDGRARRPTDAGEDARTPTN